MSHNDSIFITAEGPGDVEALPILARKALQSIGAYHIKVLPPFRIGGLNSAIYGANLQKAINLSQVSSSTKFVMICLDLDDGCIVEKYNLIKSKIPAIYPSLIKPIGICFFQREYETMFLRNGEKFPSGIVSDDMQNKIFRDAIAAKRDAKGSFSSVLLEKNYRESRDQARYTAFVDIETWQNDCSCLAHFCRVVSWGANWDGKRMIY